MRTTTLGLLLGGTAVLAACSDEPNGPDPEPVTFTFYASHERITTPGHITFTASSDKPLARVEIYESGRKVGESVGTLELQVVEVAVASIDNGARTYVAKGYDAAGTVGTSDPVAVEVDIRWDSFRVLEGGPGVASAFDATGAVYVTTLINEWPNLDLTLAKYNADGKQLWLRRFGGPLPEYLKSTGVGPNGRAHLAGDIYDAGARRSECFLVVYDPSGSIAWTQEAPMTLSTNWCTAASDAAGNYYLAGVSYGGARDNLFLAKFDANGNVLWMREHEVDPLPTPTNPLPTPNNVAVDPLGGVYVAGSRRRADVTQVWVNNVVVLKFDAQGDRVWSRVYGTGATDTYVPTGLAPDPEGGVYLTGFTERQGIGFVDAFLVRYSPDGTLLWERRNASSISLPSHSVAADQSGVYMLGRDDDLRPVPWVTEARQGPSDAFLAKLSRSGDLLWVRLLGGAGHDVPHALQLGTNGDVTVLAGVSAGLPGVPAGVPGGAVLARHRNVSP